MSKKWIAALIVLLVVFLPVFPVKEPVKSVEPMEVPVNYKILEQYVHPTLSGLFNWELEYVCTIQNVDEKGGTFVVTANFYDGDKLVYSTSDEEYIGPGQTVTFRLKSNGLSFSTDWRSRYKVEPEIVAPTKIETHVVTEYYTKYVSLAQLLSGGS